MSIETIADIVVEMRKRFEPYAKSDSNDARYVAYLGYAEFADRIEQAVTNCNQLKMREALNQLLGLIDNKFLVFSNELEPSEVSHAQYQIDKAGEVFADAATCKESLQVGNVAKKKCRRINSDEPAKILHDYWRRHYEL